MLNYIETDINYFANKIFKFDWFNGEKWANWLKRLRKEYIDDILIKEDYNNHSLATICSKINRYINDETIITLDAGNHTGWPQRYIQYSSKCMQIGIYMWQHGLFNSFCYIFFICFS